MTDGAIGSEAQIGKAKWELRGRIPVDDSRLAKKNAAYSISIGQRKRTDFA
jgi:hypothetical protein